MAPSKIIRYGLERDLIRMRVEQGLEMDEIVRRLNDKLRKDGVDDTIHVSSVKRYLTYKLPAAMTVAAHEPRAAERGLELAMSFGEQFQMLNQKLLDWIEEAESTNITKVVKDKDGKESTVDLGPDWSARLGAARELREHLKLYADLAERIYNAAQVKAFQEAVMETIESVDPAVARQIERKLQAKQSHRIRALLGS